MGNKQTRNKKKGEVPEVQKPHIDPPITHPVNVGNNGGAEDGVIVVSENQSTGNAR